MKKERSLKRYIDKKVLKSSILYFLNITLVLISLNFLSNNFYIIDIAIMHISTLYLLLALLILNLPFKKIYNTLKNGKIENNSTFTILIGFCFIVFSFFILVATKILLLWLAAIPILLSGLDITLKGIKIKRNEFFLLSIFSLTYAIFYLLIQKIPEFWYLMQRFSLAVSSLIGSFIGKSMALGPSVSGFWILIIFFIMLFVAFFLSPMKKSQSLKFILSIIGLFIVWIIYLIILGFIEFESKNDVLNLHFIVFFLCFIPIFFYLFKSNIKEKKIINLKHKKINIKKIIKNGMVWALLFLFLSTVILTIFLGLEGNDSEKKTKIMFYGQNMLGSWDIPEYGKYGREASGMFGLLPIYLNSSGFENIFLVNNITTFLNMNAPVQENITKYVNLTDYIKIIESNKVTANLLQDIDIFVITSINKTFSIDEKEVIWDFVKKGGSLLVSGDHTNVGNTQEPLNDLLTPVDISFQFDSALPLDSKFKWLTCYQLIHHPITSNIISLNEIQISVGASLSTSPNAIPLVIGRYGLSDEGDPFNKDIAYLGDYEYNWGEQLGDLILAAATYYGDGKVIVFGDTSTFQNSALPYSYPFIYNVISWLKSEQTGTTKSVQNGVSIFLLIIALIIILVDKKANTHYSIIPLVFILALIIAIMINAIIIPDMQMSGNVVYIDASHNERFNLEPFTEKSVNGFILNLNRNGYLPLISREFSKEKIEKSKFLIIIAPTQSFNSDELEFLHQYMSSGGIIILSTGYTDKEAVSSILEKYDLDIINVPLGPFPYVEENPEEFENEPRFVDSWPIIFNENIGQSYYNFTWINDYHLMVFVKQGKGGLLLISDSQFLLDKNIESIYDYWPGNIILLKHIIDETKALEEQS